MLNSICFADSCNFFHTEGTLSLGYMENVPEYLLKRIAYSMPKITFLLCGGFFFWRGGEGICFNIVEEISRVTFRSTY